MHDADLFNGLKALADSAFPKRCTCCGRVYANSEDFFRATKGLHGGRSSIKTATEEDGSSVLEVFRNCVCGSTLMESFGDRRDASPAGLERRRRFGVLQEQLVQRGLQPAVAKAELLKLLRGQRSEVIEALRRRGGADLALSS